MQIKNKEGFTLIELIIVIAILSFVSVVGIRSYANLREIQAKKVNVANIKRIAHALNTYETIHKEMSATEYFNNFDSLIDASTSGGWTGAAGTIDFGTWNNTSCDARQVSNGLGIYDGSWKVLAATYNAAGQGSGTVPGLASAQDSNKGMRTTGLYKQLGIYYLSATDATLLKNAGINQIILHNPSTAQASGASRGGYCNAFDGNGLTTPEGLGKLVTGGGPGHRPDLSAFYPVLIKEGQPVAIVQPTSSIYKDLGYDLSITNSTISATEAASFVSKTKLIAFGIGLNAKCVLAQTGLGDAPYNPFYDATNYRQYIAIFAIKTGGQGVASTCRLAGVVDCAGNTVRAAEYGVNWTTKLDE